MMLNKKRLLLFVSLFLIFSLMLSGCVKNNEGTDYSKPENWAYYGIGENRDADLFFVCPTVDMGRDGNYNMPLEDEKMKQKFIGAINMEKGIYEEKLTMYAPYYRQVTFPVYFMPEGEAKQYFEIAYSDVRAAFLEFIKQTDPNRPFVLAGFSQGADMVLRLQKEFFNNPDYQKRLIASYCIGWRLTDEEVKECPWMKPAAAADDLGSIICFSTESEGLTESFVVSAEMKTHAINPLNWKTDSTFADASMNLGACFTDYSGSVTKEIPKLTGAYIEPKRGVLKAPDIIPADYETSLFPNGVYHLYDYQFFYRNLQSNVALRVDSFLKTASQK